VGADEGILTDGNRCREKRFFMTLTHVLPTVEPDRDMAGMREDSREESNLTTFTDA
jgi:hypothetical protein